MKFDNAKFAVLNKATQEQRIYSINNGMINFLMKMDCSPFDDNGQKIIKEFLKNEGVTLFLEASNKKSVTGMLTIMRTKIEENIVRA
ncbi:hypothetical protein [Oenococcus sicerae]|uniref:hypothetical protein n=1 Tax=Oenococcus sicerae TaxID=2203724 RepID=UPI0039ED204A